MKHPSLIVRPMALLMVGLLSLAAEEENATDAWMRAHPGRDTREAAAAIRQQDADALAAHAAWEKTWHLSYAVPIENADRIVDIDEIPDVFCGRYMRVDRLPDGDHVRSEYMTFNGVEVSTRVTRLVPQRFRKLVAGDGKVIAWEVVLSPTRSIFLRLIDGQCLAITDTANNNTAAVVIATEP